MILGYSGIAASGEDKMGLAHRNEDVDEIILDPILQWTVPKHISLKDAASIPLAYLMVNISVLLKYKYLNCITLSLAFYSILPIHSFLFCCKLSAKICTAIHLQFKVL